MYRPLFPLLLTSLGLSAQAPPARLTWGFEERVRSEAWNNLSDHSDASEDARVQYRFRTRLWGSWQAAETLRLSAGLVNEDRHLARPDKAFHGREVVFETLRADWRFLPTWELRVGRQDLMRGEGFVLFDGTPLDGSRSTYFNAAVLAWQSALGTLDVLALDNPRKDRMLPRFNEATNPKELQQLGEWDLRALGAYFTRKGAAGQVEAYALHATATGEVRPLSNPLARGDRRLEILGGRTVLPVGVARELSGEATVQIGKEDAPGGDRDIRAWGAYGRLRQGFAGAWKPSLSAGLTGLSGADPNSRTRGGWEPLFSRWPKWSELQAYAQAPETGIADFTNLLMTELEAKATPHPKLDLRVSWLQMRALKNWAAQGPLYGPGKSRGTLLIARGDLNLGHGFKAHALYEWLKPGDFYAKRDSGHFLRFEVSYRFQN